MATMGDALIASWNGADWGTGGGGGTEPAFLNTEDLRQEPTVFLAKGTIMFVGWTQATRVTRKTIDHVRKEHRYRLKVWTQDKTNKEERLDEVLNELEFLIVNNPPTGYDQGEVEYIDRSLSDKSKDIYALV